ncbi:MAG: tetratricopeptide repeat protein [Candidatus Hydrogenedentes bacterium]|nr:tetratricopeptide repeat protein [Candidatus Hydrogenedentota bacterium]
MDTQSTQGESLAHRRAPNPSGAAGQVEASAFDGTTPNSSASTPASGIVTPEPDAVSMDERDSNTAELDVALSDLDMDSPLARETLDKLLAEPATPESDTVLKNEHGPITPSARPEPPVVEKVPSSTPDAPVAEITASKSATSPVAVIPPSDAGKPDATQELVSTENLAAAVPAEHAEETVLSQDLMDSLVKEVQAEAAPLGTTTAPAPAVPTVQAPKTTPKRKAAPATPTPAPPQPTAEKSPSSPAATSTRIRSLGAAMGRLVRRHPVRLGASLAVGILGSLVTYSFLSAHQVRLPGTETWLAVSPSDIKGAYRSAQNLVALGRFPEAIRELDAVLAEAPPGPERADAAYLRLESAYKSLPEPITAKETEQLVAEIDRVLKQSRTHPRAPEALLWKADLLQRTGDLPSARSVYLELLEDFGNGPHLDQMLFRAGELALSLKRGDEAAGHFLRLLEQVPGSTLGAQAKLGLGDAQALSGKPDEARRVYTQLTQAYPDQAIGAEAVARLGRIAFDAAQYDETVRLLEGRLETATSIKGNDRLYLLLAKAYRAQGRTEETERVLRELIEFFPDTQDTAAAYVELSQVLEALNREREALRIISRGADRFPRDAEMLRKQAELLKKTGNPAAAGQALVAALKVGKPEPGLLLEAARSFSKAGENEEALETYERLLLLFPSSPEGILGGVEMAEVEFEAGKVRVALGRLEGLSIAAAGQPQQLPALLALGRVYGKLGLTARAADVLSEVTRISTEPEVQAKAAVALFDSNEWDEGMALAGRIDASKLSNDSGYALLVRHARAMMRADPERGLEKMEHAFQTYPQARTSEGDQWLLEAYLAANQTARARALVADLETRAKQDRARAPALVKGALTWGDALYEREDYRTAVEAYTLAATYSDTADTSADWAKYQQANALCAAGEVNHGIALYDEIAASKSAWADDAAIRANYVRLDQRLHGKPVPAPQTAEVQG